MKQVTLIIQGRVQMVRFRDFTKRTADALGVCGDVQNQPDGTVLIHAWADEPLINSFIDKISSGSPLSRVDKVDQIWDNKTYEIQEDVFKIIR